MRRLILYAAAVIVLLSLLTTVLVITTYHSPTPHCPRCGTRDAAASGKFDTATIYTCGSCKETFYGPPRQDFSWAEAIEDWVDGPPVVE